MNKLLMSASKGEKRNRGIPGIPRMTATDERMPPLGWGSATETKGTEMTATLHGRDNGGRTQSNGRHGERRTVSTPFPAMTGGAWGAAHIQEDLVLPEQYFDRLRRKGSCPGEEQLMLAVLEDAVHCYKANLFAHNVRRQKLFAEAEEWLFDPESDAIVTFDYVCGVFGLDAGYLRAGLRRWREDRQQAAVPTPMMKAPQRQIAESAPFKRAVGE